MKYSLQNNNHIKKDEIELRKITHTSLNKFITDLNNETWQNTLNATNPNDKFNKFLQTYTHLMDKNLPKTKIKLNKYKHKNNPWISTAIMNSIKSRDKLVTKLNKEKNNLKKTNLISKLKNHRYLLKKVIKKAKQNYWNLKFNESQSNMKETWNNIRKLINRNTNKLYIPDQLKSTIQ